MRCFGENKMLLIPEFPCIKSHFPESSAYKCQRSSLRFCYAVSLKVACHSDCIELAKNPIEGFSAGLVDESNVFEVFLACKYLVGCSCYRTCRHALVRRVPCYIVARVAFSRLGFRFLSPILSCRLHCALSARCGTQTVFLSFIPKFIPTAPFAFQFCTSPERTDLDTSGLKSGGFLSTPSRQ